MEKRLFGRTADGREITEFTMDNGQISVSVLNLGGVLRRFSGRDRSGDWADVVLGYDSAAQYEQNTTYFGSLVGRCANRLAHARFSLNGREYSVSPNTPPHHLHGGFLGFNRRLWDVRPLSDTELLLEYVSPDGEEGYPGTVRVQAFYRLEGDTLEIRYESSTDRDTLVNLTNHSYFNLAGDGDILGHTLRLFGARYCPAGPDVLPTGECLDPAGTVFDFSRERTLGDGLAACDPRTELVGGYDHHFEVAGAGLRPMARLCDPSSGRTLEVSSTLPGLQLYSGQGVDDLGKEGKLYPKFGGVCLETQFAPDAVNRTGFAVPLLRAGETRTDVTRYRLFCIS